MKPINESVLHTLVTEGMITEGEKPLRNRVEVITTNDKGQVYGGIFPDGSFGLFGGGTDGEAGKKAAQREFEEETGHGITQVQKVDLEPVETIWRHDPKKAKDKDRQEQYRGTRTWFFTGKFQDGDGKKASGDDGKSPLKDIGWYDIDDAIKRIEDNLSDQQDQKAQQKRRIEALRTISDTGCRTLP